jgi:hypothetical protein
MRQSILAMDKCDIFELTEALYVFCILNHSGMSSELYSIQCQIGQHYKAGYGFSESKIEEENMFYPEITEDNVPLIWTRLEYVLDNRWDDLD